MTGKPPPPSECQAELHRLLDSETFRHSDGLHRLLEYLGKKALNGGAAELKEYTIGIEAFDKSSDYDPQLDPAVRVLASKLRHKLEDYYLKQGVGNPSESSFPRATILQSSLSTRRMPLPKGPFWSRRFRDGGGFLQVWGPAQ